MAREAEEREDLLRDAVAYRQRAELELPSGETVFIGFRAGGEASFYFDQDPVYHFNAARELRRAFIRDRIIKAERGMLLSLHRRRSSGEVHLLRHELSAAEAQQVLDQVRHDLARLAAVIDAGTYQLTGQVPPENGVPEQAGEWIAALSQITIARSPRV